MKWSDYIKGKRLGDTEKCTCHICGNKNAIKTKDGRVVVCSCGTYVNLKVTVKKRTKN